MKKEKKFFISWINDPNVENDYYEVWNEEQLLLDFNKESKLIKLTSSIRIGRSFIYFDCDGHMMVITRVPSTVSTTI